MKIEVAKGVILVGTSQQTNSMLHVPTDKPAEAALTLALTFEESWPAEEVAKTVDEAAGKAVEALRFDEAKILRFGLYLWQTARQVPWRSF